MDRIKFIFKNHGLPMELSVLPHVESSFQVNAYSSAGAAGIWQFTRGTGRLFMKVGYDVDERRDPILSTTAAAKLLKKNFRELKSWPLAITAYNHGLRGMMRGKKRFGPQLVDIINGYRSRTFGFASQNFYAEFLAALHVVKNKEKYFPNLNIASPKRIQSVRFDKFIDIVTVMDRFGMSRGEVALHNPALRRPVISGQKRIPRGFVFQAPHDWSRNLEAKYKTIPASYKHERQIRSKWYTVHRGDTLSAIALRFRTSVTKLKRMNNIRSRNRIYVGQVLRLPQNRRGSSIVLADYKSRTRYLGKVETVQYRVRRNDNLSKIAGRFNTNPLDLAVLNRISDPDMLYPGQNLNIPKAIKKARISPSVRTPEKKKENFIFQCQIWMYFVIFLCLLKLI